MAKALVEKVFAGEGSDHPGGNARRKPAGHGLRAPVPLCGAGQARLVRGVRQLRHHGRTARASCTSPPPLARTTTGCASDNGLPFVQLVDTQGCLTKETKWPGVFVKKADPLVLEDLEGAGTALRGRCPSAHDYPFCWRCDTPLLYYARAHLVHPHDRRAGQPAAQQPLHQLDARPHQGRPHGQLPGKRHRLGH